MLGAFLALPSPTAAAGTTASTPLGLAQCPAACIRPYCATTLLALLPLRLQKQKVDYLNLPPPIRYEDSQREAMSEFC
jgi:hypothetical protein